MAATDQNRVESAEGFSAFFNDAEPRLRRASWLAPARNGGGGRHSTPSPTGGRTRNGAARQHRHHVTRRPERRLHSPRPLPVQPDEGEGRLRGEVPTGGRQVFIQPTTAENLAVNRLTEKDYPGYLLAVMDASIVSPAFDGPDSRDADWIPLWSRLTKARAQLIARGHGAASEDVKPRHLASQPISGELPSASTLPSHDATGR